MIQLVLKMNQFLMNLILVFRNSLKIGQTPGFDDLCAKRPSNILQNSNQFVNATEMQKDFESNKIDETQSEAQHDYFIYGTNEFCFIIMNAFDRPSPVLPN